MATDLIARGLAAAARSAAQSFTAFADIAASPIAAQIRHIDAGSGTARGMYMADAGATQALASAHPLFCRADALGRYFRLLPDDDNLIPVACAGALGQAGPVTDASVDDRAAIQAALDYARAIGAAGIRLDARHYAVRRNPITAGDHAWDPRLNGYRGLLFRCQSTALWKSTHALGSDLWRRRTDGTAMVQAEFQVDADGYVWRGGGIWVDGVGGVGTADPGVDGCASLTLDGVRLQGGLPTSGNGTWPASTATGDGWDLTDKGIWQANDQHGGHLTFRNGAG